MQGDRVADPKIAIGDVWIDPNLRSAAPIVTRRLKGRGLLPVCLQCIRYHAAYRGAADGIIEGVGEVADMNEIHDLARGTRDGVCIAADRGEQDRLDLAAVARRGEVAV